MTITAGVDNIVPDMYVNIIPNSSSSKIKLQCYLCGEFSTTDLPHNSVCAIKRTIDGVPNTNPSFLSM